MPKMMGHLDRGRLPRHRQDAARRRVAAEVHQDVDLVGPNLGCHLVVRETHRRAPGVRHGLEALGDVVLVGHLGVADDLELLPVQVPQQGIEEVTGGMLAEVGR